jgi:hypothetical protein
MNIQTTAIFIECGLWVEGAAYMLDSLGFV